MADNDQINPRYVRSYQESSQSRSQQGSQQVGIQVENNHNLNRLPTNDNNETDVHEEDYELQQPKPGIFGKMKQWIFGKPKNAESTSEVLAHPRFDNRIDSEEILKLLEKQQKNVSQIQKFITRLDKANIKLHEEVCLFSDSMNAATEKYFYTKDSQDQLTKFSQKKASRRYKEEQEINLVEYKKLVTLRHNMQMQPQQNLQTELGESSDPNAASQNLNSNKPDNANDSKTINKSYNRSQLNPFTQQLSFPLSRSRAFSNQAINIEPINIKDLDQINEDKQPAGNATDAFSPSSLAMKYRGPLSEEEDEEDEDEDNESWQDEEKDEESQDHSMSSNDEDEEYYDEEEEEEEREEREGEEGLESQDQEAKQQRIYDREEQVTDSNNSHKLKMAEELSRSEKYLEEMRLKEELQKSEVNLIARLRSSKTIRYSSTLTQNEPVYLPILKDKVERIREEDIFKHSTISFRVLDSCIDSYLPEILSRFTRIIYESTRFQRVIMSSQMKLDTKEEFDPKKVSQILKLDQIDTNIKKKPFLDRAVNLLQFYAKEALEVKRQLKQFDKNLTNEMRQKFADSMQSAAARIIWYQQKFQIQNKRRIELEDEFKKYFARYLFHREEDLFYFVVHLFNKQLLYHSDCLEEINKFDRWILVNQGDLEKLKEKRQERRNAKKKKTGTLTLAEQQFIKGVDLMKVILEEVDMMIALIRNDEYQDFHKLIERKKTAELNRKKKK